MVRKLSLVFCLLAFQVDARLKVARRSCQDCVREFSEKGGCNDESQIEAPAGCEQCMDEASAECEEIAEQEEYAQKRELLLKNKDNLNMQLRSGEVSEEEQYDCDFCSLEFAKLGGCEIDELPSPPGCQHCAQEADVFCVNMEADMDAGLDLDESLARRKADREKAEREVKMTIDLRAKKHKEEEDERVESEVRRAVKTDDSNALNVDQCITCAKEFYTIGGCDEQNNVSPPEGCDGCDAIAAHFCEKVNEA
jgi:hypothetical protein